MTDANHPTITPFLTFEGKAEEAMSTYVALFENSKVESITRYGPGEQGKEGTVQLASFSLNGRNFMCIDSPVQHGFTFTPAVSIYVTCSDESKVDHYFEKLSQEGQIMMPLGEYPFSKRFVWLQDKFGVSWQLSASS